MNKRVRTAILFLLLILALYPLFAWSQGSVPLDFEIIATSGALTPSQENFSVRITADGQGIFTRFIPSAVGEPPIEENGFMLTNAELEQIWQAIQANDFFNLDPEHSNPEIEDRTFARLLIRANGNTYEVTTQNIAVPPFDNIIETINNSTPPGNDLEYDISTPENFISQDVCNTNGNIVNNTFTRRYTKEEFLNILPEVDTIYPDASSDNFLNNQSDSDTAHAGTTVGYRTSLQEAVNLGVVTLEGKGGFYGDQVSIEVDNSSSSINNNLEYTLYLEFWGPTADSAKVQKIKDAIENAWSGQTTSDGKTVTVNVETRLNTSASSPPGTAGYHQIKLVGIFTSEVVGLGSSFDVNEGVGSGTFETSGIQLDEIYAHEAGHLLGLSDRYEDYRKQVDGSWKRRSDEQTFTTAGLVTEIAPKFPNLTEAQVQTWLEQPGTTRATAPDDPNDLMSTLNGQVQQSDIDAIAAQAGLVVEVRPGDVLVNKDGSDQNFAITRTVDLLVPATESRALPGLFVACIDLHKGIPSFGARFDLAPSLNAWGNIDAAPLLLGLLRYVDEKELFCESDFATQVATWRISDNLIGVPEAENLLQDAGIDLGDQNLDFPRISNPNSGDPDTESVDPPELAGEPGQKDPGHPYVDVDNDGLFVDGTDIPLTNGEVQDGVFDTRVSEGGYDAGSVGCDADTCGLVLPASTGPISVQGFTYISDGNLVVDTNLTGTRPTTTSSLESRSGSILLDDPTVGAPRKLTIIATQNIVATGGDIIQVNELQGAVTLNAGGTINVSGSTVKGGRTFTMTAGAEITATGATLENTDFNAGTTTLTSNAGPIKVDAATVRGGRQTTMTASGDIDASGADILITTASSNPFVRLMSGGNIDITNASITDSGGNSMIALEADIDIDCTGSTLTANSIVAEAGGTATNCP